MKVKQDQLALCIRKVLLTDEYYIGSPLAISFRLAAAIRKHYKKGIKQLPKRSFRIDRKV